MRKRHQPGRRCLGDREAALVEGPADDRALDVGGGVAGEGSRSARLPTPPEAITWASVAAAIAVQLVDRRALHRSVDLDRGAEEAARRRARSSSATASATSPSLVSVQPASATLPSRASTETTTRSPCASRASVEELGVAQGRGADHDPLGAGLEHRRRPTAASRRPPPTWIGHSTAAAIRRTASRFCGLPGLRPVEVDDVQELGAFAGPAPRGVDRVGVVGGLALVVALQQAHGPAAADVDRRVEDHAADAGTAAQIPAKLESRRRPGGARLLRVELDAEDVVALAPRRRSGRRRRRCRAGRPARAAARRSGRSRRASRSRSPRRGATPAPSAPATSRCAGP